MAKKHSTKTATKEALQASEPKLQQFSKWNGISVQEAPHSWTEYPYDAKSPNQWPIDDKHNQSDLQTNMFTVQNNLDIKSNGSVETRNETLALCTNADVNISGDQLPLFTGVNHVCGDTLYFADNSGNIRYVSIADDIDISGRVNSESGVRKATTSDGPSTACSLTIPPVGSDEGLQLCGNALDSFEIVFEDGISNQTVYYQSEPPEEMAGYEEEYIEAPTVVSDESDPRMAGLDIINDLTLEMQAVPSAQEPVTVPIPQAVIIDYVSGLWKNQSEQYPAPKLSMSSKIAGRIGRNQTISYDAATNRFTITNPVMEFMLPKCASIDYFPQNFTSQEGMLRHGIYSNYGVMVIGQDNYYSEHAAFVWPGLLYDDLEHDNPFNKIDYEDVKEADSSSSPQGFAQFMAGLPIGTWWIMPSKRGIAMKVSTEPITRSYRERQQIFYDFMHSAGFSDAFDKYTATVMYDPESWSASSRIPVVLDTLSGDTSLSLYATEAEGSDIDFSLEATYKVANIIKSVDIIPADDRSDLWHYDQETGDIVWDKTIIWDSINDVLGDIICFGHYTDDNGDKLFNIYKQVYEDESTGLPYDNITIKAYAAIPDPNVELKVGYYDWNDSKKWKTLNVSDCRVGFMYVTPGRYAIVQENHTSYDAEHGFGPGYTTQAGTTPGTEGPTNMYQYFRCKEDPLWTDVNSKMVPPDTPGAVRVSKVGSGVYGNQFQPVYYDNPSYQSRGMLKENLIYLTLPSTKVTYTETEGAAPSGEQESETSTQIIDKKFFQDSALALWRLRSSTEDDDNPDWHYVPVPSYIGYYDVGGERINPVSEPGRIPKLVQFPIVTGSITSGSWGPKTLRVVDPIDANRTDSNGEPTGGQNVFKRGSMSAAQLKADDYWARYSFCYVYTNELGHTLASQWRTVYANLGAEDLSTATGAFRITQWVPEGPEYESITGVDIFVTKDDYKTMAFAGHMDFQGGPGNLVGRQWVYDWYGASSDVSEWTNASLTLPEENTTRGPETAYMDYIDNKCYFYGGNIPHRLYIGGRPGSELSLTAGLGGGWLDVNPGSGNEIKKLLKFKTYNGANIVTILTSHPNYNMVRRYNLIQNNVALTNELSTQGYSYEEVSNVVGAISHWGAGVWAEGLYTLSRYGLCLTTQQMENSNNLRAMLVSGNIEPIFTDAIAKDMHQSEMIFSNEVVYFVLKSHDLGGATVRKTSDIIFCYDVNSKGWYTYTVDGVDNILSLFNLDYEGNKEGVGIITPDKIMLIPNGGIVSNAYPEPDRSNFLFHTDRSLLETGELSLRTPPAQYLTLSQLELRFDYFIGDVTIEVTGVDYYGRHFNVRKTVSEHELMTEYPVYIRVDKLLQTYNLRINGYAHYRLTHILTKVYQEANKIDLVYGFDSDNRYKQRAIYDVNGNQIGNPVPEDHHAVRDYNNLREAIVP